MTSDFPAYAPSEEHELLRRTVRDLAEAKIAPAAADVDAAGRFPQEALDALTAAGLHAVHIPEAYGGEGADALATVIVIEEVARVCASSSLIPAESVLGCVGVVTTGIDKDAVGEVGVSAAGQYRNYAARATGSQGIAKGRRVRVVRMAGGDLIVEEVQG